MLKLSQELSSDKKSCKRVSFASKDFPDLVKECGDGYDSEPDPSDTPKSISSLFPTGIPSMETALQSLDSLNEQILQFIISSTSKGFKTNGGLDLELIEHTSALLPQQGDALYASLAFMRTLLMDAQAKFKKMVDNNRRLASRIDETIKLANQEVKSLRDELNLTNEKLKELSASKESCSHCQDSTAITAMEENSSLMMKNRQLEKEIANLKQQILNSDNRNKKAIEALKNDRQRLKCDKAELLKQVEEMQKTINDKEEQLCEFIREFDLQVKENDEIIKEADADRIRLSKEQNDLSRKHENTIEIVSGLREELVARERKIRELESELLSFKNSSLHSHNSKRRSVHNSLDENCTLSISGHEPNSSMRIEDPLLVPSSPASARRHLTNGSRNSASSTEELQGDLTASFGRRSTLVHHLSGSLSRVFKKSRNRKSLDMSNVFIPTSPDKREMSQEEKKDILSANQNVPMNSWKADAVLVWLELVLHLEQYAKECEENVKSGKILLGLSECEIEKCLGITNPLHCRKLCLARDEFRSSTVTITNMSAAGQLDHWWVSQRWLRDVGLLEYASRFREHLIDGRTLSSLSRKDLERHFAMERKLHQDSVIHGVELLQILAFNTERLEERRMMCQSTDTDLLVWNNSRLIQWVKSIDLKEYSGNLRDSGLHGALIVLDTNFTSDDMASVLGIPPNKATVRRHLACEFDELVKRARESLNMDIPCYLDESGKKNSLSRSTASSHRGKKGIRSSLSRGLGRQLSNQFGGK